MNRETFTQIAKEVLGQYESPAKLDELFDQLRAAARGPVALEYRPISPASETSFQAVSGDLVVASIRKEGIRYGPRVHWRFAMAVNAGTTAVVNYGNVDDLESAKVAVLKTWELWLDLADLRPR
jgi:hypothetical protein